MKKKFRSFNDARKFAHSLKLKNRKEWEKFCKSNKKPDDIPADPNQHYKNKGWKNLGDWLGTGKIGPKEKRKQYLSFEESKKFVRKLKLKNRPAWRKYSKSDKRPTFIPPSPEKTYKKEWIGMGDWLDTKAVQPQLKKFRTFEKARKFVHLLGLKNTQEWRKYANSGKKPADIPWGPYLIYKNKGWKSMGDWLGTGIIASQIISKQYLSFNESKKIVRELAKKHNLRTTSDFVNAKKQGLISDNIPAKPWDVYSKNKREKK